jgi:chromosome segregation ATPase
MPKKNDQESNGEQERQSRSASPSPLEERHRELQAERRQLEAELLEVDRSIRAAIENGDLATLDKLALRKAELPRLFIAASTAETKARNEISNAEDQANVKQLDAALAERDQLKAKLEKRQEEIEAELAALKHKLAEAEGQVNVWYAAVAATRNFGAERNAGFKRSLAALTGV